MMGYLHILRPVNLLIITFTQSAVYYLIIQRECSLNGIDTVLHGILFPLFVLTTLILAGTANIINDILDQKTDRWNKSGKKILGNNVTRWQAVIYYFVLITTGSILALYIALKIDRIGLFVLFPIVTYILYLYSSNLKSVPLVGNIVVSLFCGLVPAITWYAESNSLQLLENANELSYHRVVYLLLGFTIFAFMSNISREIVKDMEDVKGDRKEGINTIAVVLGLDKSKVLVQFNTLLLLILSILWIINGINNYFSNVQSFIAAFLMILPPIMAIYMLSSREKAYSFNVISRVFKIYMALGLISLIILI